MSARKLFDKPKRKIKRKLRIVKAPKRYRYTNDQIHSLPYYELEYLIRNGTPEEKDAASIIKRRRDDVSLSLYGYIKKE